MKVVFRDARLETAVRTAQTMGTGLPEAVIKSAYKKLFALEAAPDERTLWNFRSFNYEKLLGDRAGQRSIRLNDQWRLVFELDETCKPPTIVIISIEDYH